MVVAIVEAVVKEANLMALVAKAIAQQTKPEVSKATQQLGIAAPPPTPPTPGDPSSPEEVQKPRDTESRHNIEELLVFMEADDRKTRFRRRAIKKKYGWMTFKSEDKRKNSGCQRFTQYVWRSPVTVSTKVIDFTIALSVAMKRGSTHSQSS